MSIRIVQRMILPGLVRSESSSVSHRKYASAALASSSFSPAGIAAPVIYRAYTDDVVQPDYLWSDPGERFLASAGVVGELQPIDLCLENPIRDTVEPADLDLVTGRLNPDRLEGRFRQVFLIRDRGTTEPPGEPTKSRPRSEAANSSRAVSAASAPDSIGPTSRITRPRATSPFRH